MSNSSKPSFGEMVRARREQLGISRTILANRANVSESTIISIELGRRKVSDVSSNILHALGLTPQQMSVKRQEAVLHDEDLDQDTITVGAIIAPAIDEPGNQIPHLRGLESIIKGGSPRVHECLNALEARGYIERNSNTLRPGPLWTNIL